MATLPVSAAPLAAALLLAGSQAAVAQTYFDVSYVQEPGLVAFANFGAAVDVHDDRMVVGSLNQPQAGGGIGSAWVYEGSGGGFPGAGVELVNSDQLSSSFYGSTVAIQGDIALVGDANAMGFTGAVYVFERQSDGTWPEVQRLLAPDGGGGQYFGNDVAIDGDTILVGAPAAKLGSSAFKQPGAGYVFERQPDGSFQAAAKLQGSDLFTGEWFGGSVALDGDRAVFGAYQSDPLGTSSGAAYVFDRQPDGSWLQVHKLVAGDGDSFDRFGYDVDVSGDYVVCGAYGDAEATDAWGSVYVNRQQDPVTWIQTKLQPTDDIAAEFGFSVALDGDQLLVGSPRSSYGAPFTFQAGAIYRYFREASGAWTSMGFFGSADPSSEEEFGKAVALDGSLGVGGAPGHHTDTGLHDVGRAQVLRTYAQSDPTQPTLVGTGTPGCSGPHTLSATSPALLGGVLGLECDAAPLSSVGFLAFNGAADPLGNDLLGFGVLLHLDLLADPNVLLFPMLSDASGLGTASLPLPSTPSLAGIQVHGQVVWPWLGACSLPPLDLSSSNLLSITLEEL